MKPHIRWAVRGTLILGVAASVAANVLHARDNPISQAIAAWPPLALLITVEVVARVPIVRRWLGMVRVLGVAVIAGIAAWVSYWHMAGVAQRYGEATGAAHLLPLSVDGLIVVASVCLVELGGRDRAPVAQGPAGRTVFDHNRPIGPMPAPVKLAVERPSGTGGDGDSAGQRARQDPRSEQDREAAVCAMRQAAPEATLRQISTATLVPVSTVRNILNRAAAQNETGARAEGQRQGAGPGRSEVMWDVVKDSGFAKPQVVAKAVTAEQAAVKRQELRAKEKPGSSANYTVRKGKR